MFFYQFFRYLQGLKEDESGQGTTEYAILVGVLVVIAIVAIIAFKGIKFLSFGKQLHRELILYEQKEHCCLFCVHYCHCMFAICCTSRITKKTGPFIKYEIRTMCRLMKIETTKSQ